MRNTYLNGIEKRIAESVLHLEQHQARLDMLKNQVSTVKRKADARRKILVGAVVLSKAERDPEFQASLLKWLDEGLVTDRDRAVFGLPPRA